MLPWFISPLRFGQFANHLDAISYGVNVMGINDPCSQCPDGAQVFDPGPEPIGDKSQVLTVAAFAGAQDLGIGHSVV